MKQTNVTLEQLQDELEQAPAVAAKAISAYLVKEAQQIAAQLSANAPYNAGQMPNSYTVNQTDMKATVVNAVPPIVRKMQIRARGKGQVVVRRIQTAPKLTEKLLMDAEANIRAQISQIGADAALGQSHDN